MLTIRAALLTGVFCCSFPHAYAASADGAVGMVLDVQGTGQISEKGATSKLQLLAYLKPHTQVTLEAGSKASLSLYSTRSIYQIAGPAKVEIGADKLTVLQGKPPAVKPVAEKLVLAAEASNMTAGAYRMRSITVPRIVGVTPENGAVLLTNRPVFSWDAIEATDYAVSVRDDADQLIAKGTAHDASWQLPPDIALNYGDVYSWTVTYTSAKDGKNYSASGEFSIASKGEVDKIAELKPAADAPVEEWVLYAAMLQGKRMVHDARMIWQQVAKQRPDLQKARELSQ